MNLKDALEHSEPCPPLDELLAASERAQQHLANCPRCAADVALYREFNGGLEPLNAEESRSVDAVVARLEARPPYARNTQWWAALTSWKLLTPALAAVAIIAAITLTLPTRTTVDPPRISGEGDVTRSARLNVVEPAATVAKSPTKLVWQGVAAAASYRVQLSEVDRTVIWSGTTVTPMVELPAAVQARAVPRKTLVWSVTALDVQGRVVAESGPQKFVVEP